MVDRHVSESAVEETIEKFHTTYTDPDGNRNFVNHIHGRRIRVVIVGDGPPPFLIKTVIAD